MEKKKATEAAQDSSLKLHDTSASAQRARVIQALRTGAKTTIQLREEWGVMSPAPRVLELRMRGYDIETVPVSAATADGVLHRAVARYASLHEPVSREVARSTSIDAANDAEIAKREGGSA
jgi:hypothetical protein